MVYPCCHDSQDFLFFYDQMFHCVYMYIHLHTRFLYPFVHRHFDCLHVLAIVNNVAMNKGLQIFLSGSY